MDAARLVPLKRAARRPDEAARSRVKILLIELPFKTFGRPSLGLALLKASLEQAGYTCDIRYANLEFAARIGLEAYKTIAEEVPEPLLLGDLVFAPAVDERSGRFESLRDRGSLFLDDGSPLGSAPDWLWRRLPALQREAASFAAACAREIAQTDATIVGFSCMFQTAPSLAVAKALKALAPQKRIAFGGSHCEGDMGLALHEAYPFVDFVGRGEGESLLVELADAITLEARNFDDIPGLVWRDPESGASRASPGGAKRAPDLDALPRPAYDDWIEQIRRAAPSIEAEDLELPFETSRGCWYGEKHHCTFCGLNGESLVFRRKSPERALADIRELGRYGIRYLGAVDLIMDHRYFETLLPALAREDFDHSLFYETKSNLTRRQVELLRDARIDMIEPGIESLSTPILKRMRKGVTALQNVRLLKWAAELGIAVVRSLLYGFPGEEADAYLVMADLIPSLTHLAPPLGGYKARADRFSPLFFDGDALGAGPRRPSPAYALVHSGAPERTERMAYHFDIEDDGAPRGYLGPLTDAIRLWRSSFGQSSFVSLRRGDALCLYDRRPGSTCPEARLVELERAIYLACDAGVTPASLADSLGEPLARIREILDVFIARRWVADVDDRALSLAVPLDDIVPAGLPDAAIGSIAHAFYVKRMASFGRILSKDTRPDGPAAGEGG